MHSLKRTWTYLWLIALPMLGGADYGLDASSEEQYNGSGSPMDSSDYRLLRLDITPSNATEDILPQSFWINEDSDWQNLDLDLQTSTIIEGNISGYTIYPYIDVAIPGEQVPVEAQVQIQLPNGINGAIVNSDVDGNFTLAVPKGSNYQMSITPLSPQNVPYSVLEDMRFESDPAPMDIDLGEGIPIYGRILDHDNARTATAQLIDTHTGIKGPQVDVADNGYFQLRAPQLRSDLTVRVQGTNNALLPTVDIPIRVEENDTDGFRLDIELGNLDVSTVFGRIVNLEQIAYADRSTIIFESIELADTEGKVRVETNNDLNGNFTVHLLDGLYKMTVIPPYSENSIVSPTSLDVIVDADHLGLGDIILPDLVTVTGSLLDTDGLPSIDTTIQFKDVNYANTIHSTQTDQTGRFSIKLPPVLMTTTILPNTATSAIQNFTTDLRGEVRQFDWTLQTGQPLSGVASYEGFAVPFALIEVFQGEQKLATGLTGQNGDFNFQIQVAE